MYVSQKNPTLHFGSTKMLTKASKLINRSSLQKVSNLKDLKGPLEKQKAKEAICYYTGGNIGAGFCTAQFPGGDEIAMAGVEAMMAFHIFNVIYKFKLSKSVILSIVTGYLGNKAGLALFKAATKSVTWIPGAGNVINAAVAGATTAALGAYLISKAEAMDDARRRGKKIDEFIKKMNQP